MVITTESLLLFFYSLTLLFFIKAIKEDRLIYWIIGGITGGLGLLSKYNMILFAISVIIHLYLCKKEEFKKKNLYIAIIIAAAVYLPNLIWNYYHDFITFQHTKEISRINKTLIHPKHFFNFIRSQFGVFGPVFFAVLLYLTIKPYLKRETKSSKLGPSYLGSLLISTNVFQNSNFSLESAISWVDGNLVKRSFNSSKLLESFFKYSNKGFISELVKYISPNLRFA
jgi:4-amino-4-deoxy-L-arabinose transferase-like glycosyltransferase